MKDEILAPLSGSQRRYQGPDGGYSLWEMMHHKTSSFSRKVVNNARVEALKSEQRLVTEMANLAVVELRSRALISTALMESEEAEFARNQLRMVRQNTDEDNRKFLAGAVETERRLTYLEGLRTMRNDKSATKLIPSLAQPIPTSAPAISRDLSTSEMEKISLMAFGELSQLDSTSRGSRYEAICAKFDRDFPEFISIELKEKLDKLLQVIAISS